MGDDEQQGHEFGPPDGPARRKGGHVYPGTAESGVNWTNLRRFVEIGRAALRGERPSVPMQGKLLEPESEG